MLQDPVNLSLQFQSQIYNMKVEPMITAPRTLPAMPALAARPAYCAETKPDDEEAEEVAGEELPPDVLVAVVFGEVSVKQQSAFTWHLVEFMDSLPKSDPHLDVKALPISVSPTLELAWRAS